MRSLSWVPFALALVTLGCGARTPLREPSDAAVTDAGPDAPAPVDGGCGVGLLACGGACVNPAIDPLHCGGCNNACENGGTCVAGGCVPRPVDCPDGLLRCGGVCVDIRADPRHCGACDNPCMGSCVLGRCEAAPCPNGLTRCAGVCVDATSDTRNCGACNNACAAGQSCARGACVGSTRPCSGPHLPGPVAHGRRVRHARAQQRHGRRPRRHRGRQRGRALHGRRSHGGLQRRPRRRAALHAPLRRSVQRDQREPRGHACVRERALHRARRSSTRWG
ncbi:MAG: hypothetical protein R3A52_02240 [Polyangiales bacterium]